MFHSIAGVSGTARESSSELWRVYRLSVVSIPTHRPLARVEEPPKVFAIKEKKYEAVIEEIERFNRDGRPVLVGSRTVSVSEELSEKLTQKGLSHSVLNAVRHEEEAAIVEKAGEKGQITIATNMAGRGTDIRLSEEVLSLGGLHVIAVEYNLSPRIDRQLIGRAGRQGEPGSARYFMSMEDELLVRFMRPARCKRIKSLLELGAPGSYSMAISGSRRSQRTAEKLGEKQREAVLRMDTWLEEHLSFTRRSSG
jgi:preprotein translocase subunit SecA